MPLSAVAVPPVGLSLPKPTQKREEPLLFSLSSLNEVVNDVNRQWEDDGRILLDANLRQCLQVSKLKRHRLGGNRRRGIRQHPGCFKFPLRVNDLCPLLTLGLR